MSTVLTSATLANGLRTEFSETYSGINNRKADGKLSAVMNLNIGATNRYHEFAYHEAAPHMEHWQRGDTIPTDTFSAVKWKTSVYTWGRRVPWHREDRKDDQLQSLLPVARQAGQSAALLPQRFFFDLITNTANTLPAIPKAPDGADMFSGTDGAGANRFGVSGGNLLTGGGVATASAIKTDYYNAIEQWKQYLDGKGQPLMLDEMIDSGVVIIYAASNLEAFEEAFLQRRQGQVMGTDAGVTPSNIFMDASRDVTLWASNRLSGNDWFIFLKNSPVKPTYFLDREGVLESQALYEDNNSDHARNTGEEYVQWQRRCGAGIALPLGAIQINN